MSEDGQTDASLRQILEQTRRIALVGASNKPGRASHGVLHFLVAQGYEVTPVNPGLAGQEIAGRRVVASLAEAGPLEMVDIFRAADQVGPVVREAIALGAGTIWMQLGIVNADAAAAASAAGLQVVMDRCPKLEIPRLGVRRRFQ